MLHNPGMRDFFEHIIPVFNSSFFIGCITAAAATVTLFVYRRQKSDYIRDAASIILIEIQKAEELLTDARRAYVQTKSEDADRIKFPEKLRVMETDSWEKYRYLFARVIPDEVWSEINNFYVNCRLFDASLQRIEAAYERNDTEVRTNIYRVLAGYSKKLVDELEQLNDASEDDDRVLRLRSRYQRRAEEFANSFMGTYEYSPTKLYHDAEYYFHLLPTDLTSREAGRHIKRMAGRQVV